MPVQKQGEECGAERGVTDCKRICFLDLDDTLIPTTWLRTEFSRLHSFAAESDELGLYSSIKQVLDRIVAGQRLVGRMRKFGARRRSGERLRPRSPATSSTETTNASSSGELHLVNTVMETIDDLIIDFIRTIQAKHDVVIIVTNARSYAWVQMFKVIFPKLAQALCDMGVGIVKTEPRTSEPDGEADPDEYFRYWCDAKYREFNKCIAANPSTTYELTCVGDNNFEHCAFMQLCNQVRPAFAHVIKCTCGLSPQQFVKQLRVMNQRMGMDNYRLGLQKLTQHVEAVTWIYDRCPPGKETLRGHINSKSRDGRDIDGRTNSVVDMEEVSTSIDEIADHDDEFAPKSVLGKYRHKLRRFLIRSMLNLEDSGS